MLCKVGNGLGSGRVWVSFGLGSGLGLQTLSLSKHAEFFESIWHIDRFTDEELQLIQYELR